MTHPPIHVYESDTAPADQRFVAMVRYETHLFAFQHGSTADDARDRMVAAIEKIGAREAKRKPKVNVIEPTDLVAAAAATDAGAEAISDFIAPVDDDEDLDDLLS